MHNIAYYINTGAVYRVGQ